MSEPFANDDELLLTWLRDRDVICPLCGYNLRGLAAPRCPECGEGVRLSVALAAPFNTAWMTATATACAAGGAGVFLLVIIVSEGRWPPVSTLCSASMAGFIAAIPLAAACLRRRRWYLRLPRPWQWGVAVGLVIVAVGNTALFALTVR